METCAFTITFNTDDWSNSIPNLELENAGYVEEDGFSVTETKSTLDNWPNAGYTKGYYYFNINSSDSNIYAFKILGRADGTMVKEVSNANAHVFFIKSDDEKWYMIKVL